MRIIHKEPGEEGEYGCHVILSLQEQADRPNHYLALVERVTSISTSFIDRLLNGIIRNEYHENKEAFTCEDQSGVRDKHGNPKIIGFRPKLEFVGHPSDYFIQEIEQGELTGITLVESLKQTQIGGRPYLKQKEKQLVISIDKNNLVKNLWNDLVGAMKSQSKDWKTARIRYKKPSGNITNITMETTTGNVLEDKFVRSIRITDIDPVLDNSAQNIVRHLADSILEQLLNYRENADQ